jgi:hypothetical protein
MGPGLPRITKKTQTKPIDFVLALISRVYQNTYLHYIIMYKNTNIQRLKGAQ